VAAAAVLLVLVKLQATSAPGAVVTVVTESITLLVAPIEVFMVVVQAVTAVAVTAGAPLGQGISGGGAVAGQTSYIMAVKAVVQEDPPVLIRLVVVVVVMAVALAVTQTQVVRVPVLVVPMVAVWEGIMVLSLQGRMAGKVWLGLSGPEI